MFTLKPNQLGSFYTGDPTESFRTRYRHMKFLMKVQDYTGEVTWAQGFFRTLAGLHERNATMVLDIYTKPAERKFQASYHACWIVSRTGADGASLQWGYRYMRNEQVDRIMK